MRTYALAPVHARSRPSGCKVHCCRPAEPDQWIDGRNRVPPEQRPASQSKWTTCRMDGVRGCWRAPGRAIDGPLMTSQNQGSSIFEENYARAFSITPRKTSLRPFVNSGGLLSRAWSWIRSRQAGRTSARRLQVATTVSLGEKRFLAVIQVDGAQFLIGGGATNVALLAQLHPKDSFEGLLSDTITAPKKQLAARSKKQNVKPAAKQTKVRQPVKPSRKQSIMPAAKQAKGKA